MTIAPQTAPEAPSRAAQRPLSPFPLRGTVRYALMNARGEYFVHRYRFNGGWREWSHQAHDAYEWSTRESAQAAARRWLEVHHVPLTVVLL